MNVINSKMFKIIILILLIIILVIASLMHYDNDRRIVKLHSCIDGDTAKLLVEEKIETVRFLAIDTPESVHPTIDDQPFGNIASDFTCNELKNANEIVIEFDPNSDLYDRYGRLLAWIFVDGELLQKKLIAKGYAKTAYLYDEYKYTKLLLEEENIASTNNVGIWYNE